MRLGHVLEELKTVIQVLMRNRKRNPRHLLYVPVQKDKHRLPVLCPIHGVAKQAVVSVHTLGPLPHTRRWFMEVSPFSVSHPEKALSFFVI